MHPREARHTLYWLTRTLLQKPLTTFKLKHSHQGLGECFLSHSKRLKTSHMISVIHQDTDSTVSGPVRRWCPGSSGSLGCMMEKFSMRPTPGHPFGIPSSYSSGIEPSTKNIEEYGVDVDLLTPMADFKYPFRFFFSWLLTCHGQITPNRGHIG